MDRNDAELQRYLDTYPAHHEGCERWPIQGDMIFRLALADTLPPPHVSSSILAIVLDSAHRALYLWPTRQSGHLSHLLIGGRPNPGETPEQTAIREVAEETGWRIAPLRLIGFRHFLQLEPRNPQTDRPYPHFIQPIYAARAVAFDPTLLLPADQVPAEFLPFDRVEQSIQPAQRPLLHAAADEIRKATPASDR